MASAKRKERTLEDLHTTTEMISGPEITPVLKGSCRMQGPAEEIDRDNQSYTVVSQDEKVLSGHSKSRKIFMRAQSGTCNVCAAPCSSCLHVNRALMGARTEEFSDETCQGNAGSEYSANDAVPVMSNARDSGQLTASETSNLLSVSSNFDTCCENAESKANLRNCDILGASEDAEMHPNVDFGSTAMDDQIHLKPQCIDDQRPSANKSKDNRSLGGHEDCLSCLSEGSEANKLSGYDNKNSGRTGMPYNSTSADLSCDKIDMIDIHSSKDSIECVRSPNPLNSCSHPTSGNFLSCNPDVKELEENLGSCLPLELAECSKEHLSSTLDNKGTSDVAGGEEAAYACGQTNDGNLIGGSHVASEKVCLKMDTETETQAGSEDMPTEAGNFSVQIEETEKGKESCGLPEVQETSLQSQPVDDSDESDFLEQDVKVCDICGDAGREDLLAVCSRCSDGAEHTYCMREMVEKVPEGDWLCEECKFDDDLKNLKQEKIVTVDRNDKNQSLGRRNKLDSGPVLKLDRRDSDEEGSKTNKDILIAKASGKRLAENIEVVSTAKRQAVEPAVGSPKSFSPSRVSTVTRDLSFRNLEKGKVKPAQQLSSGNSSDGVCALTSPRLRTSRGPLIKSSSFNSAIVKPKVEIADDVGPQTQKSAREPGSFDMKEGAARLIGKSMSFKSVSTGRLNASESKVKMLSPKFSHGQDLKGLKPAKERNLLERKSSFKSDRTLASSAMGNTTVSMLKTDKKPSPGETCSLPSANNNRDLKGLQSDSKSSTLSTSLPARKGETKRQTCPSSVGGPLSGGPLSTNGISSFTEQKVSRPSLMDDTSASISTAERPFNANGSLQDVLARPRGSTTLGERTREIPINRSRSNLGTGGRSLPCQKCKEIGHSVEFCTVDSPRPLAAAKSPREVMNKGNELKAAIEAAMLKKPSIYRKSKVTGQSDELSISSTNVNSEIRSDQFSTSVNTRNVLVLDELHEGPAVSRNFTADSCKQTAIDNMKQFPSRPSEAATIKAVDLSPVVPSTGKPSISDLHCHALAAVPLLLKISAIPEHEYVWQGCFEVHRSGKLLEFRDGIQAHLSTCSSPKVLEMVNKFPSRVLLNEVPRSSTWPVQFQEAGVKEDNIALYFFAKDLESYEKSYKGLLETMIKNDLALKGNFDGVELLIFPSHHLPEKSQRWNLLYFLWGVFRGKKVNCLPNVSGSPLKCHNPGDNPEGTMSTPASICSLGPVDGTQSKGFNVARASEYPASVESPCLSSETVNEDCDNQASSLDLNDRGLQANVEEHGCTVDATSLSGIEKTAVLSFQETRCTNTSLEETVDPECILEVKLQQSVQAARTALGSGECEKAPIFPPKPPDIQHVLSSSFDASARMNGCEDHIAFERTSKEEERSCDVKAVPERDMRDQTVKELNNWQPVHAKLLHEDPAWTVSQASSGISRMRWNDTNSVSLHGIYASTKQSTAFPGTYGVGSSCPVQEERGMEACNDVAILKNKGTTERYFFPVDSHPAKDCRSSEISIPWKVLSSEDADQLHDAAPNLELALGAPFLEGKVDLNDDLPLEKAAIKEQDDEVPASLSLSLSFPFPDKELTVTPISKVDQLLPPNKQHVNTSRLFLDSFLDE